MQSYARPVITGRYTSPDGLALRMYDYRGKRCVARTLREPAMTRTSRGPITTATYACNYSRSSTHCTSLPRLIVKIASWKHAGGSRRRRRLYSGVDDCASRSRDIAVRVFRRINISVP